MCTNVLDFNSKNLQLSSKLLIQGNRYHKLRKYFRSYSDLLSKFGEISFQEYVTERISHPVFYGDIFYKLRRVRCEANFVTSGSKIVKRLQRRMHDPLIIENTIGLVLGSSTALYRSFLKRCNMTNKGMGTIWWDLSKPPQRRQCPDPRPLWLLVGTPLVIGPELASRGAEHSLFWRMSLYTWFRPPIWDLLMLQLLRPNSSNLPCLYSTFHLEYPLVLSRFCLWYTVFITIHVCVIIFMASLL